MSRVECVPNVSEGRRPEVIAALAEAVRSVAGVALLHVDSDVDHHRTVYTFTGAPAPVAEAAFRLVEKANALIDLAAHEGVHPRRGAADVVPFVPLAGATREECAALARDLAARLQDELGLSVQLYDDACTNGTSLPEVRKRAAEGTVAVGARAPLIAFNVQLESTDLDAARAIARAVRGPGIRALGFPLASRGCVQVSMNLLGTTPLEAFRAVEREAAAAGITVRDSEVVGMAPREVVDSDFRAATRCTKVALLETGPDLLDRIAAPHVTPAGGSAAAYAGAMAAALVAMSCPSGKQPRLAGIRARADELRFELHALVEEDAAAFRAVLDGGGAPAMERATLAPLAIAEKSAETTRLAAEAKSLGVGAAGADCHGGLLLGRTAAEMAVVTVRTNLRHLKNRALAAEIRRRLEAALCS